MWAYWYMFIQVLLLLGYYICIKRKKTIPKFLPTAVPDCLATVPPEVLYNTTWLNKLRNNLQQHNSLLEKSNYLRQWVHQITVVGYANSYLPINITDNLTVNELYCLFTYNLGGVHCGACADFYRKLCIQFSINCCTCDVGNHQGASHVVALVEIDNKWVLQDPFFNATLQTDKGETANFLDFLACYKASHLPFKFVQHTPLPVINFLYTNQKVLEEQLKKMTVVLNANSVTFQQMYGKPVIQQLCNSNGKIIMRYKQYWGLFWLVNKTRYQKLLLQHFQNEDFIYLFFLPKNIHGTKQSLLKTQIEMILAMRLPIIKN